MIGYNTSQLQFYFSLYEGTGFISLLLTEARLLNILQFKMDLFELQKNPLIDRF